MLGRSPISGLPIGALVTGGGGGGGGSSGSAPPKGSASILGTAGARLGAMMLDTAGLPGCGAASALSLGQSASADLSGSARPATSALAMGQTATVTLVRSDLPLTPLMTSDTAPLGTASSTALYGSGTYPAYLAFDGLNGALSSSVLSAGYPAWWQFQFPSPQKVTAYALWARSDGATDEMPRSFKLWGSPDGTNWTQVSAVNNATNWQVGQKRVVLVDTPDWYTHYKLTVTSNNGSVDAVSIGELLLYGPSTAIPRLTSNTTPAGTASSSDSLANAYKAFDGDYHSSSVASQSAASFPVWWQYQFTAPVEIKSFALWAPFEDRGAEMPQAFSLQGSTDGIAWTTLSNAITTETNWHPGERRHYPLAVTGAYAYYRLTVTSNNGDGGYCSFGELSLMTERIPAVLADATSHLAMGHAAATATVHGRAASSNVVFSTIPYLGQHLTGGAASALVFNYATGARHTSLRDATSALALAGSSVRTRVQFRGATSALTFGQNSICSLSKRGTSNLPLSQSNTVHKRSVPQATSVLAVAQTATGYNTVHHVAATDPLAVVSSADVKNRATHLAAASALQLIDAASVHPTKPRLSAVDQVVLDQTIVRAGSQHCGAVSHLAMADTNRLNRPIRVDATDTIQTMGFVFDPDTLVNSLVVLAGLSDAATTVDKRGVLTATSHLSFGYSALGGVTHAAAIAVGATSALSLGQAAYSIRESATFSALQLGDLATVVSSKPASDQVTLGHKATVTVVRVLSAESGLTLGQVFVYESPTNDIEFLYKPRIGQSLPDLPTPPPGTLVYAPDADYPPTTFLYPAVSPSDTLTLRSPELGNKDRLAFNRISRETRGGTLVVYADPIWPKTQVQVLSFTGLSETQAADLLNFMSSHLGLEIGFVDWENRLWKGVITNPTEAVTQDGQGAMFAASLEFEGALA
jgi:hypothetical protein